MPWRRPWVAAVAWMKSARTDVRAVMPALVYGPVWEAVEERKSAVDGDGFSNTEDWTILVPIPRRV